MVIDRLAELAAENRGPLATVNQHLAAGSGNWRVVARS
jgi:hypothetical protein